MIFDRSFYMNISMIILPLAMWQLKFSSLDTPIVAQSSEGGEG
jgi:hypothetical protein